MIHHPLPIDTVMSLIVESVSQRILPQLQAANPNIQSLSFMFGHPTELKMLLKEMTESRTVKYKKFPCIMLFSDVRKARSSVRGSFNDVILNMVIAMSTEPTYTAAERTLKNFDPILRPIYKTFIQQIWRSGFFWVQSERELLGRDTERYFWGREGIQGNDANKNNDYIDAIEIGSLQLNQSKKGNGIYQNTFTQLMEFFLSETRATITVGTVTDNKITNNFFLKPIISIEAELQVYVAERDFTQTLDIHGKPTGEIVGININFYTDQIIIAHR